MSHCSPFDLTDRTALITGASSGIGAGVAAALAAHGASVAINYPTPEQAPAARDVCARIEADGGNAIVIEADVSDEAAVERLVSAASDALGAINVLVNNAGIADVPADILEQIRLAIPKGRIAEVADIVPSYVFLASAAGSHYQGQCLSPNGGDVFL